MAVAVNQSGQQGAAHAVDFAGIRIVFGDALTPCQHFATGIIKHQFIE